MAYAGFLIQVADVDSFQQDEDLSKGPQDYLLVDIDRPERSMRFRQPLINMRKFIALHRMD